MAKFVVYYDGACEPTNPGKNGGFGCVVFKDDVRAFSFAGYLAGSPILSCNVAEYAGLIRALEWLAEKELFHEEIQFFGDSQLTVFQMNGKWKAKAGLYLPYYARSRQLAEKFSNVRFSWIPREENQEADELSKVEFARRGIRHRFDEENELNERWKATVAAR